MDEEDIDDLLDEVEFKFCNRPSSSSRSTTKSVISKQTKNTSFTSCQSKSGRPNSSLGSLNDMIDDIMEDDGLDLKLKKTTSKNSSKAHSTANPTKCLQIFLAGSSSKLGLSSDGQLRVCENMHCTDCDNSVVSFDDQKWNTSGCDYLFFRNNYPDYSRLKSQFLPRKGYRSYCCQCRWLSVNTCKELKAVNPSLKWICKKHK